MKFSEYLPQWMMPWWATPAPGAEHGVRIWNDVGEEIGPESAARIVEAMAEQEAIKIATACQDDHYYDDIRDEAIASFARIAAALRAQM